MTYTATSIPTESRIFVDRYFRHLRQAEAIHANLLSRGAKTWEQALIAVYDRMGKYGSPVKAAAVLNEAISHLKSSRDMSYGAVVSRSGSRAAQLSFLTFTPGRHALAGVEEDGLRVERHLITCSREGRQRITLGLSLAYASRHALARLHERSGTDIDVSDLFTVVGALGGLVRDSVKHNASELSIRFGDTLLTGSTKFTVSTIDRLSTVTNEYTSSEIVTGPEAAGRLYDIRTALPCEWASPEAVAQGSIARKVAVDWMTTGVNDVDQIPFIPRRDDYTLQVCRAMEQTKNGPAVMTHASRRPTKKEVWNAVMIAWLEAEYAQHGLNFGTRGWMYRAELAGKITKAENDYFTRWLGDARKDGLIDPDRVTDDAARKTMLNNTVSQYGPDDYAQAVLDTAHGHLDAYTPIDFWEGLETYVEVLTEKIDVVVLFSDLCEKYHIPLTNARGSFDINGRRAMLKRFRDKYEAGFECVLLYIGDFDPHGLKMGDGLLKNLQDCSNIRDVQWDPTDKIEFRRIFLTLEQIEELELPWIDNLTSANGKDVSLQKEQYIQDYVAEIGVKKCECNALATKIDEAKDLFEEFLQDYIPEAHLELHEERQRPGQAMAWDAFTALTNKP